MAVSLRSRIRKVRKSLCAGQLGGSPATQVARSKIGTRVAFLALRNEISCQNRMPSRAKRSSAEGANLPGFWVAANRGINRREKEETHDGIATYACYALHGIEFQST